MSTVGTVTAILIVVAAAIVIPMQVMRARSTAQVARALAGNPGEFVVAAIRSPIGKKDFEWLDRSFHPDLFYTLVADRRGLTIWEGGSGAKAVLTTETAERSRCCREEPCSRAPQLNVSATDPLGEILQRTTYSHRNTPRRLRNEKGTK